MILPIVAYGAPVLKQHAEEVPRDYPELDQLIADMYETMYNASGVGLAAPQVDRSLRLFIVDGEGMNSRDDVEEDMTGFRQTFINPEIVEETGAKWNFEEGCLSIPDIRNDVSRSFQLTINYLTPEWEEREETYTGVKARIIQHEYDHIEGILFTDYAKPLRKQMLRPKLQRIARGQIKPAYPMLFPQQKKSAAR